MRIPSLAMSNNRRKNLAAGIATAFLLLALLEGWPYGYFTLLRFVVCIAMVLIAYLSYQEKREGWTWSFVVIAILFNPIVPIYLAREAWWFIDLVVAAFLGVTMITLKLSPKNS